jgi:phosphotransacetylase
MSKTADAFGKLLESILLAPLRQSEIMKKHDPETYWDMYTATISLKGPDQKHLQVKMQLDADFIRRAYKTQDDLNFMVSGALHNLLQEMKNSSDETNK